jgi:hypothetical protein
MHQERVRQDLSEQIRRLETSRRQHVAAVARIDQLLGRISDAIESLQGGHAHLAPASEQLQHTPEQATLNPNRPRHYRKVGVTGDNAVLAFVRGRGSATTAEINRQWRSEGRGGVANNAILRLLRRGELVRESLRDQRGSAYRCPPDSAATDRAADRDVSTTTEPSAPATDRGVEPAVADPQFAGSRLG